MAFHKTQLIKDDKR